MAAKPLTGVSTLGMISTVASAALVAGCQRPVIRPARLAPAPQPPVVLVRAGDRPISPFGEFPDRGPVPFYGRATASMVRHTFTEDGADYDPDLDAGGERMLFCSTRHADKPDLYLKHVQGTAVTQLTSDPASEIQPAFSPDGTQVAFTSDRAGSWDIWIMGINGQAPVQVTDGPADDVHPSWSPDGTRLAYSSLPADGGPWELWVVNAQAGATKQFIGHGVFPEWSPVEDKIVYQRARERGSHWFSIWTMDLADGEPRYPTEVVSSAEFAAIAPTWSRDGKRLAFCTIAPDGGPHADPGSPAEPADIWIVNADGTERVRLTDGHGRNFAPVWSRLGRVFFTAERDGTENIWSIMPPTDWLEIPATAGEVTHRWPDGSPGADQPESEGTSG